MTFAGLESCERGLYYCRPMLTHALITISPFAIALIVQLVIGKASIGIGRMVSRIERPEAFWGSVTFQLAVLLVIAAAMCRGS